ncbi:phosphotransferase family protein [Actinosynnema sp. CA-248983]
MTKRRLSAEELDALVSSVAGIGCRLESELTDGWFNTAYRVVLDDGRPAVVKLAPPAGAPVLRYERGILGTEAMVYRRIAELAGGGVAGGGVAGGGLAGGGVPGPELLFAGEEFIVLSVLDGVPWDKATDLAPETTRALRRELGFITARLHTLRADDGRFGYPAAESGLSAGDWRTAFSGMVEALLDDAARWGSPLGVPAGEVRSLVALGGDVLDEVVEPRLVHFDLWPGNVFVDAAVPRIAGLIDHERAFWGDPAAELVSLAFGGDAGPDSDLVAGYVEGGGTFDFSPGFRHRLALYRLYLGLLLVVECGPRGYGDDHLGFCRGLLADSVAGLRELSR